MIFLEKLSHLRWISMGISLRAQEWQRHGDTTFSIYAITWVPCSVTYPFSLTRLCSCLRFYSGTWIVSQLNGAPHTIRWLETFSWFWDHLRTWFSNKEQGKHKYIYIYNVTLMKWFAWAALTDLVHIHVIIIRNWTKSHKLDIQPFCIYFETFQSQR
jgi:hypothetical protein